MSCRYISLTREVVFIRCIQCNDIIPTIIRVVKQLLIFNVQLWLYMKWQSTGTGHNIFSGMSVLDRPTIKEMLPWVQGPRVIQECHVFSLLKRNWPCEAYRNAAKVTIPLLLCVFFFFPQVVWGGPTHSRRDWNGKSIDVGMLVLEVHSCMWALIPYVMWIVTNGTCYQNAVLNSNISSLW